MPERNPELLPGTLDLLILHTLRRGPNHGYGIALHIHRTSEEALRVGEGSLYPALQRLLVSGWVKAAWGESDTGRRVRLYTLTAAGKKQLAQEIDQFGFMVAAIHKVLEA
jgi:transcriptional regulator